MRRQSPSFFVLQGLTRAEDDVLAQGVGARIQFLGRLFRCRAGMHSHAGKILAEAWFEKGTKFG